MDSDKHLVSCPGTKGWTFSEKPAAASLSVIAKGKEGVVMGEFSISMDKLPQWLEFIGVVTGVSQSDVEKVLRLLAHQAGVHRGPNDKA